MGTLNVLEAARAPRRRARRVRLDRLGLLRRRRATSLDEDALLAPPAHLYTAGKLSGELFCRSYAELYGLAPTVLRFGIPYGPRARPAAVIPSFVRRALDGTPLTIAGTGEQERVLRLRRGPRRGRRPGAGPARRRAHVQPRRDARRRRSAGWPRSSRRRSPTCRSCTPRAAPPTCTGRRSSATAPSDELGWTASTPLAEGVARYVAWLRAPARGAPRGRAPVPRPGGARARRPRAGPAAPRAACAGEPAVAGGVALIAVLSCLLTLWGAATGNEQRDAVTMVGVAALLPLTTLTLTRWPVGAAARPGDPRRRARRRRHRRARPRRDRRRRDARPRRTPGRCC